MKNRDRNFNVSIIVPTYNRSNLLKSTLDSLVSIKEIDQIIVVNDFPGSQINYKNHKVEIINNSVNLGESGAVNKGYLEVKNNYFSVVSDDDPQPRDWLCRILNKVKNTPGYIAYYPSINLVENGKVVKHYKANKFSKKNFYSTLQSYCLAGVVINKSLIPQTFFNLRPEGVEYPNDLIQWLNLSNFGDFIEVDESIANWNIHSEQYSNRLGPKLKSELYLHNLNDWKNKNYLPQISSFEAAILLRSLQFYGFMVLLKPAILWRHLSYSLRNSENCLLFICMVPLIFFKLIYRKVVAWRK